MSFGETRPGCPLRSDTVRRVSHPTQIRSRGKLVGARMKLGNQVRSAVEVKILGALIPTCSMRSFRDPRWTSIAITNGQQEVRFA